MAHGEPVVVTGWRGAGSVRAAGPGPSLFNRCRLSNGDGTMGPSTCVLLTLSCKLRSRTSKRTILGIPSSNNHTAAGNKNLDG